MSRRLAKIDNSPAENYRTARIIQSGMPAQHGAAIAPLLVGQFRKLLAPQ